MKISGGWKARWHNFFTGRDIRQGNSHRAQTSGAVASGRLNAETRVTSSAMMTIPRLRHGLRWIAQLATTTISASGTTEGRAAEQGGKTEEIKGIENPFEGKVLMNRYDSTKPQ